MEKLVVRDLSHSFGPNDILDSVDLALKKGESLAVIGPSGGGKSTLLRLVAGLIDIDKGEIENSFSNVAVAFQDARLLPWKTTVENIALGLIAKGIGRKNATELAKEYALRLGLEEADFDKYPKDLSGGMRQRVSFARALVLKPDLMLLDEPFSALDIGLKRELWAILSSEVINRKMSLLFITHDLMEAVRLSHKILLLKSEPIGHIVKEFEIDMALEKRDDEFVYKTVAKLLADREIIDSFELKV